LQRLNACIRQQAGSYEWIATQSPYGSAGCRNHQSNGTGYFAGEPDSVGAGLLANPIRHSPLQRLYTCIRQQAGSYEWIATQSPYDDDCCRNHQSNGTG
jgi:hypothetical protein